MNDNQNKDTSPTHAAEIPPPTAADLKWQKAFDKRFDKTIKKNRDILDKPLLRMIQKAVEGENLWCFAHALKRSAGNSESRFFLFLNKDIGGALTYRTLGKDIKNSKNPIIPTMFFEAAPHLTYFDYKHQLYLQSPPVIKKWMRYDTLSRKAPALCAMARAGTLDDFKEIYDLGVDINHDNSTALMHAVQYQDLEFVKFIVENKGDYTTRNFMALTLAEEHKKPDIQSYLLQKNRAGNHEHSAPKTDDLALDNEWQHINDTMIVHTTNLPNNSGRLKDYFDFAAKSMNRVEENEQGIFPHFRQNFSDIENQGLVQRARKELIDQGGDPDAPIFKKQASQIPGLKNKL